MGEIIEADMLNLANPAETELKLRRMLEIGRLPVVLPVTWSSETASQWAALLPPVKNPSNANPDGFGIYPPTKKSLPVYLRDARSCYGNLIKECQGIIGSMWKTARDDDPVVRVWYNNKLDRNKAQFVDVYSRSILRWYIEDLSGWELGYLGPVPGTLYVPKRFAKV